jgi:capsular exopolysaccharide synthesis family protein
MTAPSEPRSHEKSRNSICARDGRGSIVPLQRHRPATRNSESAARVTRRQPGRPPRRTPWYASARSRRISSRCLARTPATTTVEAIPVHPDQVRKLVRKWIIPVVAMTLIGAVIAFFVSKSLPPIYEATGDVLVLAGPGQSVAGDVNLNATEATTTAATLLTQAPVLQKVINSLQLNVTTEALARQVSAVAQSNTELVAVTVRDPSAQNAATIANAIMGAYVSGVTTLGTVSVAVPAAAPLSPASPRTSVTTALGAVAGFALALGLVALLEFLNQGLHTAEDVRERLGLPCLGVVPYYVVQLAKTGEDAPKLTSKQQRRMEAAGEAYRRLRINLLFGDNDFSSVVLTSARVGEGKTRTAANLAVAIANSDKHVVLIDADMRHPSQHRLFDKPIEEGVSELILATTSERVPSLNGTYATQYDNLVLITCGTIPPNPSELLASKRASRLFHSLAATYDMLIIDTPPAQVVTDALSVATECSATVVVIEAGKTNAGQASAVIASLRNVGANVIGVVLNKARERDSGQYYQYDYADKAPKTSAKPALGALG